MIWIRADANQEIGSGHVMRCLSIAAALERTGRQVCFLIADENAAPLLQARSQPFLVLHSDYRDLEGELETLRELFAKFGGSFFLADSYYVTAAYFRQVKERVPVGYIDDKCLSALPVDVLINYNIFADVSLYEPFVAPQLFLGTKYAPLREEFAGLTYQVREKASKVLVTTGGSDRYNLAGLLLQKALDCPETAKLEYCVVSGAYNAHLQKLRRLEERYGNVKVYSNVSNMPKLMQNCDIAVTAGGSTMYELSAVGVPMVCFSFVDNQERIVEGFSKRKLVCFGGNYLTQGDRMLEEVVEKIALLAGDFSLRQRYSEELRCIVDGHGAERIAQALTAWRGII